MFPMLPDPTAPSVELSPLGGSASVLAAPAADPAEPEAALAALVAGNRRFVAGRPSHGHLVGAALAVAHGPRPVAAVVGCMDARVPVEAVFDQCFGSLCVTRSAGHVLDRAATASVELAVDTFGVRLVVVLGHTRCAAVAAAVDAHRAGRRVPGHVGFVLDDIGRSIIGPDTRPDVRADGPEQVARRHVARTVSGLQGALGAAGRGHGGRGRGGRESLRVAGALYDVDTGRIELL
jgi:carbonic anhydrase